MNLAERRVSISRPMPTIILQHYGLDCRSLSFRSWVFRRPELFQDLPGDLFRKLRHDRPGGHLMTAFLTMLETSLHEVAGGQPLSREAMRSLETRLLGSRG